MCCQAVQFCLCTRAHKARSCQVADALECDHSLLQISTGAQNDLEKITQMAYSSVAVYGMNAKIGLVSFPPDRNRVDKPYSDETAQLIDREAREIIDACYQRTLALLREKKDAVEALAQVLPRCTLLLHSM